MSIWIKALRLPICFLAGLLAIAGFRVSGIQVFWTAIVAVVLIACSTMLQNDWRDRYHDVYTGKMLSFQHPRAFFVLLLVFWTVVCGFIVLVAVKNSNVGGLLATMALAGLIYSEIRMILTVPTILVALVSGSSALLPIMVGANAGKIWPLFISVVFIIFGREIMKDIDDQQTDDGYKWTIPLAIGNKFAKVIAIASIIVGVVFVAKISLTILFGLLPFTIVSVILLIRDARLKTSRIYLDLGITITLMLIVLYN